MGKTATLTVPELAKAYCLLTKPRIIFGNLVTAVAGFALASREGFNGLLFLSTLTGLTLVIAAACIFNNCIDKEADKKMSRTQNRALVTGAISSSNAFIFACILVIGGCLCLELWVNSLTLSIALVGFLVYVGLYSFSKYSTSYATLIGSIAGAVPPVIGYVAVQNQLDLCGALLFALLVLWQMPHFFAIALYRVDDYSAASIPVLPLRKGTYRTKTQMILYIFGFTAVSSLLYICNYAGLLYLTVTVASGLIWAFLGIKGFKVTSDQKWGRMMFHFSLIVIMATSISIVCSR